jgi:hypothetical protein
MQIPLPAPDRDVSASVGGISFLRHSRFFIYPPPTLASSSFVTALKILKASA